MRAWWWRRRLGPLLALPLGGAGGILAATAFEVYCESAGVNLLACQRLDETGSGRAVVCVDSPPNSRTCTTPNGEPHTCVRSRGNVFTCEQPLDGSSEHSDCLATGKGVYACEHDPHPPPRALPMGGALKGDAVEDDDNVIDDADLDHDLGLDDLDD